MLKCTSGSVATDPLVFEWPSTRIVHAIFQSSSIRKGRKESNFALVLPLNGADSRKRACAILGTIQAP